MKRTTFEYFLCRYKNKYLLYLDPYYFSFDDIMPRREIKEITLEEHRYSKRRKKRMLNITFNKKTVNPFDYLMDYWDEDGKGYGIHKVIVNNSIEMISYWWQDLFLIANEEIVFGMIEKHKKHCKANEFEILNKLPGKLNTYFKIKRDSTVDEKRMDAKKFLKYILEGDLYLDKIYDIENSEEFKEMVRQSESENNNS